ncbi:MAG: serine protease, partial [Caldilineaceae bacterium]|nr:serine protease [Caldilineaceae bacterium]
MIGAPCQSLRAGISDAVWEFASLTQRRKGAEKIAEKSPDSLPCSLCEPLHLCPSASNPVMSKQPLSVATWRLTTYDRPPPHKRRMPMSRRPAATRLFIAVLLLALLAAPVSAAPEQPTIIGGQTAAAGEFPYMVALVQANGGSQFCGGSLIAANWVLTAAHCFFNDQNQQDTFAADVSIVTGVVDLTSVGSQTVGVTRIVMQDYGQNQSLDIALLELAQPVTLGSFVQVIAVNTESATPATGSNTTITGWGATTPDG